MPPLLGGSIPEGRDSPRLCFEAILIWRDASEKHIINVLLFLVVLPAQFEYLDLKAAINTRMWYLAVGVLSALVHLYCDLLSCSVHWGPPCPECCAGAASAHGRAPTQPLSYLRDLVANSSVKAVWESTFTQKWPKVVLPLWLSPPLLSLILKLSGDGMNQFVIRSFSLSVPLEWNCCFSEYCTVYNSLFVRDSVVTHVR